MRKITLGTLQLNDKAKEYVNEALNSNRLSKGKYTELFEKKFAEEHGCKHGIFMNSGTSALQVSLEALKEKFNYQPGDEVLVPATTFIATSNVVIQAGLKPVFVDVDPRTYNIDPSLIENRITPKTRAIIPVHLFGLPADMSEIQKTAKWHGLQVIEDSCETMFANIYGKRVGSWSDLGCFSTYVAHLIVGGVGGIVTTNDDNLAALCRSLMAHGRDPVYTNIDDDDNLANISDIIERRYSFGRVGFSYRATELEAAIALSEFDRWPENILTRRDNAFHLSYKLQDLQQYLQIPFVPVEADHSFMMYPMVCEDGVDRKKLLYHLEICGIETRYLFPLLSQPIYKQMFPLMDDKYPEAQRLAKQGFFIGMHQNLSSEDIMYVSDVLHGYFKK